MLTGVKRRQATILRQQFLYAKKFLARHVSIPIIQFNELPIK
ncbi:hypothetical protein GJA_2349 [Janthinobacterium agaricidamnosum NBRC 102515 = DSM 9628]|uniref:Uncharacterized protein n=1 Tax=Janthinobacterium agaricidamnosum NBRC 102515 = DSM 9628 TaxID=1349767 RepID=W0V6L8_9BURK|nr:hypothetical protein GJA_2349 [Janthinobacterium agaricidamnosum NBRC 102515 = DSM 9628]